MRDSAFRDLAEALPSDAGIGMRLGAILDLGGVEAATGRP